MTEPVTGARRRISPLDVARILFLVLAVGFGWWGLRSNGSEIRAAVADMTPVRLGVACAVVLAGLAMTGMVWRRVLGAYGHRVPARPANAIFFVGQLGKYIPGSIWSLGAQADMGRAYLVRPRTTVAVGLLFLAIHVATAMVISALLGDLSEWPPVDQTWVRALVLMAGLGFLSPPVLNWLGDLLAHGDDRLDVRWRDSLWLAAVMAAVWLAYGVGVLLVIPPASVPSDNLWGLVAALTGAFAVAYVVGVAVVLAPAGVGAREATLIALLAPTFGVGVAAAVALLVRAVHTVCDFAIAGIAWAGRGDFTRG